MKANTLTVQSLHGLLVGQAALYYMHYSNDHLCFKLIVSARITLFSDVIKYTSVLQVASLLYAVHGQTQFDIDELRL